MYVIAGHSRRCRPTDAAGCEKTTWNEITATLERLLQQVDALHLPSTCKLWLYQHFVVPKLFTAIDLSQTFVTSLQSKATIMVLFVRFAYHRKNGFLAELKYISEVVS